MEDLLKKKKALKEQIESLSKQLAPVIKQMESLRDRIEVLKLDYTIVLDEITDAQVQRRNAENAKKPGKKKEWITCS